MSKKTISLVCATAAIGAFGMSAGTASAAVTIPNLSSLCAKAPVKLRPACNTAAPKVQSQIGSLVSKVTANPKTNVSLDLKSLATSFSGLLGSSGLSGLNLGSLNLSSILSSFKLPTTSLGGLNIGSLLGGLKLG